MGAGDVLLGEMLDQLFLDGFRGFGGIADESEPVRHAEHVRVNGHGRLPEGKRQHHVGRLSPHARQTGKSFHCVGNLSTEVVDDLLSHCYQVLGFAIRVGYGLDVSQNLLLCRFRERLRGGVGGKQRGRDHIYPLVGALRR